MRRFRESTPFDLVVAILNASQIDRQLRLALQVRQLGLPALVLLISAKYRQGLAHARHAIAQLSRPGWPQRLAIGPRPWHPCLRPRSASRPSGAMP